jgi:metal-responsive CopG/Arc/MetJ family transcriptional regulator
MRASYATVKIPQELATKLDDFAVDLGYRSRAEIVNDAIRRFIDERKRLANASAETQIGEVQLRHNPVLKVTH